MAKTEKTLHIRMTQPKSAKQQSKAAANVAMAQVRLDLLKDKQNRANEARALGFGGRSDDEVILNRKVSPFNHVALSLCGKYSTAIRGYVGEFVGVAPFIVNKKILEYLSVDTEAAAYVNEVARLRSSSVA
jgi:hypothetical protein